MEPEDLPLLEFPLLATLALPPKANTIAVNTADLPDPFSPDKKVSFWLGWNVKVYSDNIK